MICVKTACLHIVLYFSFFARLGFHLQIYKRGSDVRIDTTLVGFDSASTWKRGNQSFIFRFTADNHIQFSVVDHDLQTVHFTCYV